MRYLNSGVGGGWRAVRRAGRRGGPDPPQHGDVRRRSRAPSGRSWRSWARCRGRWRWVSASPTRTSPSAVRRRRPPSWRRMRRRSTRWTARWKCCGPRASGGWRSASGRTRRPCGRTRACSASSCCSRPGRRHPVQPSRRPGPSRVRSARSRGTWRRSAAATCAAATCAGTRLGATEYEALAAAFDQARERLRGLLVEMQRQSDDVAAAAAELAASASGASDSTQHVAARRHRDGARRGAAARRPHRRGQRRGAARRLGANDRGRGEGEPGARTRDPHCRPTPPRRRSATPWTPCWRRARCSTAA